ncbi:trans-sulfuration enzyme family protein [Marinoscillum pacificum]|uniref:trans-sulfuration enzyme family protein n=1 Tax=Marinoscillum pacificum TaxID=392723 RepID=UPI00215850A2|nr:PLP-dependent aspartate aminotransferase family protein [Marinoscillum pacificum]
MDNDQIFFHLGEGTAFDNIPASPAIYQTSNFTFNTLKDMSESLQHEDKIPFYTRGANPTTAILQQKLAALEGTEEALVFGSGSAAITAAVFSQIKSGDHVVCVENPYSWTKKLLDKTLSRFGVSTTYVNASDSQGIIDSCQPNTTLIYLESPNSWTYEMQDIEQITAYAKSKGIITIMDNSCASPLYQQPAKYGIDIIVHSATKYLSGHADMVAGVLCTSKTIFDQIFQGEYMTFGGILSPFESWLMIRSLRTLDMRMERVTKNALIVADFLEDHPKVEKVIFSHSKNYPQPELRDKYLKAAGGLMTIDLATKDFQATEKFCNTLKRFKLGCSWGGFESLAFPAVTTMSSLNYDKPNTLVNRIRLYIGMESSESLIEDLTNALNTI